MRPEDTKHSARGLAEPMADGRAEACSDTFAACVLPYPCRLSWVLSAARLLLRSGRTHPDDPTPPILVRRFAATSGTT